MEEKINDWEERNIEIIHLEEDKELGLLKSEETLWEVSDSIIINIRIIGIPEGEERERVSESFFKEIIAETFINQGKALDIQVHKANRIPCYLNAKQMKKPTNLLQGTL